MHIWALCRACWRWCAAEGLICGAMSAPKAELSKAPWLLFMQINKLRHNMLSVSL